MPDELLSIPDISRIHFPQEEISLTRAGFSSRFLSDRPIAGRRRDNAPYLISGSKRRHGKRERKKHRRRTDTGGKKPLNHESEPQIKTLPANPARSRKTPGTRYSSIARRGDPFRDDNTYSWGRKWGWVFCAQFSREHSARVGPMHFIRDRAVCYPCILPGGGGDG